MTKTTNKRRRTATAMLTAVMMMTTATSFAASADNTQAVTNMNTTTAMTKKHGYDNDTMMCILEYGGDFAKTVSAKTLEKGLNLLFANVPFGSAIADPLKNQLLDLVGLSSKKEETANDLAKKLDELSKKLDKLEETMTTAIDDQTAKLIDKMQDSFAEGTFRKDMDNLQVSVNIGSIIGDCESESYSNEDKIVKMAMITGNSTQWQTSGMLLKELINVANDLSGKSYMHQKNMFQLLYSNNTHNYKLSGEVMDLVNPYAVKVVIDYIKYAALALASLNAQQLLLGEFNASKITDSSLRKQYDSFASDKSSIEKMKVRIMSTLIGVKTFTDNGIKVDGVNTKKNYGSVLESYKEFAKTYRLTYLPSNKNLSPDLVRTKCSTLIDNNIDKTTTYGKNQRESTSKKEFEDRIQNGGNGGNSNTLTIKEMEDLFKHINKVRKGTALDFLTKMGFVTKGLKTKTDSFVTGGGYVEKGWSFNTDLVEWSTFFDTASLETGAISLTYFKKTRKYYGLSAFVKGTEADIRGRHDGHYLMIAKASDRDIKKYQDSLEKKVEKDLDNQIKQI